MKKAFILCIAGVVLYGRGEECTSPDTCRYFEITVLTSADVPVKHATIDIGVDFGTFRVATDRDGVARLPNEMKGSSATIHKDNYIPKTVGPLEPGGTYRISRTLRRLVPIGEVRGRPIRFESGSLLSLEYQGDYFAYAYNNEGVVRKIGDIGDYMVDELALRSGYLIVLGRTGRLPTVFTLAVLDLRDPSDPQAVYEKAELSYESAYLVGDNLILAPPPGIRAVSGYFAYGVLDMTYPESPQPLSVFRSDSYVSQFADTSHAIGVYCLHRRTRYCDSYNHPLSVLQGGLRQSFQTVATLSEKHGFDSGAYPPYFVIENELWKLTDW